MAAQSLSIPDDHPLVLELNSLRSAASRYQHEAHAASVNLQRQSLEASHTLQRCRALEYQNGVLEGEVIALRANPDATASTTVSSQVTELTLALRKLSDKLTLTEEALSLRTNELVDAKGGLARLHHELDSVRALAAEARAREEEASEQEREIEQKLRASEQELNMAELVIQEYADLVRTLEGRKKSISSLTTPVETSDRNNSSSTLVDNLAEGRYGLQKLLEEHNAETERLAQEKFRLQGQIAILSSNLEVERQGAEHDREQLSIALHELEKYRIDDNTAAKMVSRYMKFSQNSTDSLQKAMEGQKLRHAATLATISAEIASLQKALSFERQQSERLRSALDELSEDISRESYGRRREISLRLALLGREERFVESLSRLVRKAKESFALVNSETSHAGDLPKIRDLFEKIISGAESILQNLDGELSSDEVSSGSVARVIAARDAVSNLIHEMQAEMDRRLALVRELARHNAESSPSVDDLPQTPSDPPKIDSVPLIETEEAPRVLADPILSEKNETHESSSFPSVEAEVPQEITDDSTLSPTPIPTNVSSESEASHLLEPVLSELHDPAQLLPSPLDIDDIVVSPLRVTVVLNPKVAELATTAYPDPRESSIYDVDAVEPSAVDDPQTASSLEKIDRPSQELSTISRVDFPAVDPVKDTLFNEQIPVAVAPVQSHITPSSSSQSPIPSSISRDAPLQQSHPILVGLRLTQHRYDSTQRGFRDCHLALKALKEAIMTLPSSDTSFAIQKVVERLDDFNEDARVELEIRIADEERLVAGYEALLSIPGAISDEINENDLDSQIRAFVDGTDQTVAKNIQQFANKLNDLQHDIACIKMVVHESSTAEGGSANSPKRSTGWSSWTAGLLTSSRPVSPGPTFGSVMTSPRLRHSSSFTRSRKQSTDPLSSDLLANLGLRISIPSHVIPTLPSRQPSSRLDPRPRTTSGLHMLGLGKRSTSFSYSITPNISPSVSRIPSMSGGQPIQSDGENENAHDDVESDVE